MKIVKKEILTKNSSGYVKLIPEHTEDLWHLYNIIAEGDFVGATTVR